MLGASMMFAGALALAAIDQSGAAKLIVIPPNRPALTINYPTMQRCERARAELLRQASKETPSDNEAANMAKQLGRPVIIQHLTAYCIPG